MKIFSLDSIDYEALRRVGGKAKGLFELSQCGLNIAPGYVITDIEGDLCIQAAADYYDESSLELVAVRSSASAEDGVNFSSAGQYETVLNVNGKSEVKKAIKRCIASLQSDTAKSYSRYFKEAKSHEMNVVVQQMVNADVSGVCFTQHDGDDGYIHIEAVRGLGESLVSGHKKANNYIVQKGAISTEGDDLLSAELVLKIAQEAVSASDKLCVSLDMEWAISSGTLYWLQARPITVTETIDAFELDSDYIPDDNVLTTCNVGEMMPGAVTPLTLSTSMASIDFGIRKMIKAAGAAKDYKELPPGAGIANVGNTMFINLTSAERIVDYTLGGDRDGVALSICGRILKGIPQKPTPKVSKLKKINNTRKYFSMLMSKTRACKKLRKLADKFWIDHCYSSYDQYKEIDSKLEVMDQAFWLHYIASAHSGAMNSALFFILLKEGKEPDEINKTIAGILEDIEGIESVDILRSLRGVAKALLKENPKAKSYSAEQLAEYLKVCEGDSAYTLEHFMKRHGHRAIREAEMRSKSWHMDEIALCSFLKSIIESGTRETHKSKMADKNIQALLEGRKGALKHVIKYLVGQARRGVVNREYTKSKSIKVLDSFKTAYWHLGYLMEKEDVLPNKDLVFFLKHDELGELILGKASLVKKAAARRRLLDEQMQYKYDEINVGRPRPKEEIYSADGADLLIGSSISRGKATGRARVVKCVEDANKLKKGEIMVAAFTDIGWSPYYSMIGALVTEVGSALSHGAVVAREYALPLVANIEYATKRIKTGDMISVDGTTGKVAILG